MHIPCLLITHSIVAAAEAGTPKYAHRANRDIYIFVNQDEMF